jgi:hypothetical protein
MAEELILGGLHQILTYLSGAISSFCHHATHSAVTLVPMTTKVVIPTRS